jgi:hypothetical protein
MSIHLNIQSFFYSDFYNTKWFFKIALVREDSKTAGEAIL